MHGMTTPRHYSRTPITEAIIDFQVEPQEGVGLSELEGCQDAAYPRKQALNVTVDRLDFTDEGPTSTTISRQQRGFLFANSDEKQRFQVRFDGFTMHRLAPYQGWGPFRQEAHRLWDSYRQQVRPRKVARVAVRYINRLDLPLPAELKDYLRTSPEVSPELPQGLAGFFMQLNVPQQDIKSTLLLRETLVQPSSQEVASVVLDIDLFRSADIPPDDAGIWALIESLHGRKNDVFEACITDRTRELIQ
jgi:uncharacterized protein (TIGR04255 family)